MRTPAGVALLLSVVISFGAEVPLPKLDSPAAVESFFFPVAEEAIFDSMRVVFRLDRPGVLVTAAANAGPEYASKVAATVDSPEFQSQYALLAEYLKLFGPCQKKQKPGAEGWWSGYNVYPGDAYCSEAAKLIFAATLWSQVHYCRQLATGEVSPKLGPPPAHNPPYRLDEVPVQTQWLVAEAVYAVTDAALTTRFQEILRKRAAGHSGDAAERDAILEAARELDRTSVNRELAGLALLKMMLRNYEAIHLRHMRRLQKAQSVSPAQ